MRAGSRDRQQEDMGRCRKMRGVGRRSGSEDEATGAVQPNLNDVVAWRARCWSLVDVDAYS